MSTSIIPHDLGRPRLVSLERELADLHDQPVDEVDIGRLSAQAVLAKYEHAAKAVEDMGASVKDRIEKLETALRECDADMKLLGEAAAAIREKGKLVYAQIDEASSVSNDIRTACAEFVRKVRQG